MPIWKTATYAGGNFTASGSMTWTVGSGDVVSNRVTHDAINNSFAWMFYINDSSVGGTPSTELRIANPYGLTSNRTMGIPCWINDNGTPVEGLAVAGASTTYLQISRRDSGNFTASTNATDVLGEIVYSVGTGSWTDVPFSAGLFTTDDLTSFGGTSGDMVTYAYQVYDIGGGTTTISLWLQQLTVGVGTPTELRVTIPRMPRKPATAACWYLDNGTSGIGTMDVQTDVNYVRFRKQTPTSAWATATNTTWLIGQLTYESGIVIAL